MNVEGDRLSSLPDDLIYRILSFLPIKEAIGTSRLSSRWRSLRISMPYLSFSTDDFSTLTKFSKFVKCVLSRRNNLSDVYSVKLKFHGKATQAFVKKILNYGFSHNIQQLNVELVYEKDLDLTPFSLFSSQSLKHLSLKMIIRIDDWPLYYRTLPPTWKLPNLTTLDLCSINLRDDNADKHVDVFSKFSNLKNLTLKQFTTSATGSSDFSIVHPRLSNLTLKDCSDDVKVVKVAAPQLETLTITHCDVELVISAPNLSSLLIKGLTPLRITTEGFHCLEKAEICIPNPQVEDVHHIVSLLQKLHNVKFLALNLEIVEILSSFGNLILSQPSPFVNLKSLKIHPEILWLETAYGYARMSTKLKSYLLDGSPGCTFTMILREEIKAQYLMAELRVLLEKDEGVVLQIESRKEKARLIMSELRLIEKLLTELPASNMDKILPSFSSLCLEADIAMSKLTKFLKIKWDENQRRLSLCVT